jgi:hypothetical protein
MEVYTVRRTEFLLTNTKKAYTRFTFINKVLVIKMPLSKANYIQFKLKYQFKMFKQTNSEAE